MLIKFNKNYLILKKFNHNIVYIYHNEVVDFISISTLINLLIMAVILIIVDNEYY